MGFGPIAEVCAPLLLIVCVFKQLIAGHSLLGAEAIYFGLNRILLSRKLLVISLVIFASHLSGNSTSNDKAHSFMIKDIVVRALGCRQPCVTRGNVVKYEMAFFYFQVFVGAPKDLVWSEQSERDR